jgi:hypothetical protein
MFTLYVLSRQSFSKYVPTFFVYLYKYASLSCKSQHFLLRCGGRLPLLVRYCEVKRDGGGRLVASHRRLARAGRSMHSDFRHSGSELGPVIRCSENKAA